MFRRLPRYCGSGGLPVVGLATLGFIGLSVHSLTIYSG